MKPARSSSGSSKQKLGPELLRNLVARLQAAFYPETLGSADDKSPFYADLKMLRQAATWPASFITKNSAGEFPADRYEEIFAEIILKVKLHGPAPEQMRRRSAYILKAVQDHWRHNWEALSDEAKRAARTIDTELRQLAATGTIAAPAELTATAFLAEVNTALATGRPKKSAQAKPKPTPTQPELF